MTPRDFEIKPFDASAAKPESLPEPLSFADGRAAFDHFQPLIGTVVEPRKPWLTVTDAIRRGDKMCGRFAEDWPAVRGLVSQQEAWRSLNAYLVLPGLLQCWQYTDSQQSLDGGEGGKSKILREGFELRDTLLGLGGFAYKDDAAIVAELDRVARRTQVSLYDEASTDLSDTVALYEKHPFESRNFIVYPTELLTQASSLAKQLPLFAPKAGEGQPTAGGVVLVRRIFELCWRCYERMRVVGRFAHAWDPDVEQRYPGFSPLRG